MYNNDTKQVYAPKWGASFTNTHVSKTMYTSHIFNDAMSKKM